MDLRDPDLDPMGGRYRKPPIKRTYDQRVVRQDRWAKWVGRALGIALVPIVGVGAAMRSVDGGNIPRVVWDVLEVCVLVGVGLAIAIVAVWAILDRR